MATMGLVAATGCMLVRAMQQCMERICVRLGAVCSPGEVVRCLGTELLGSVFSGLVPLTMVMISIVVGY